MSRKKNRQEGSCHVVTVGTSPAPQQGGSVVEALLRELTREAPRKLVLLATEDATSNVERLREGLGLRHGAVRVCQIGSPHSLDEAYQATAAEFDRLEGEGFAPEQIVLHYTAGTKVMSAAAVLAAINHGVKELHYLYSPRPREASKLVVTRPEAILADKELRLALALMRELRFRAAAEILDPVSHGGADETLSGRAGTLLTLAQAFADWDSFRLKEFLARYERIQSAVGADPLLAEFALSPAALRSLGQIGQVEDRDGAYPDELLLDLMNNAIRRLIERRPDDALIRLHRAAELYAQVLLLAEYGIRNDDLEIRKVPPRHRTAFEAERRLDDATIKLGMRRSYDLLGILGHPIGEAFRESAALQTTLKARRNLVLAHGTRPASMQLALEFFRAVEKLLRLRIKDLGKRMDALQFPWIKNEVVLKEFARPAGAAGKKK